MTVTCSLESRPRVKQSLLSKSLQHTHEDRAQRGLQALLDHLQALMPNVPLLHGPGTDLRRGYTDRAGVHVNTSNARLDTPMHEYGHIVIALAEQHDPTLLDHARTQLLGTQVHEEVDRTYPVGPAYSLRDQLTETLNRLVGESATLAFAKRERRAQTVVGQVLQAAQDYLQKLTGRLSPLNLRTATLAQTIGYLSDQLLLGPTRPDVDAAVLHELFKDVAVDQQVQVELPATSHGWLQEITGKSIGQNESNLGYEATKTLKLAINQGDTFTLVDAVSKAPMVFPYTNPASEFQRKADIIQQLRERSAHYNGELTATAVNFYALDDEARDQRARRGAGATPQEQERDQKLHQELAKVFPDFLAELGDKVVAYDAENAALLGRAYRPAFDNGTVVVHLYERTINGKKVQHARVAALTSADLTEKGVDEDGQVRPLLSGLYNPSGKTSLLGSIKGAVARLANDIKLSGAAKNVHMLHATLLGMHLQREGFKVEGLSVVKLDRTKTAQNQALNFSPTEHLAALKALSTMPKAIERLQAQQGSGDTGAQDLLDVLTDPKLYEAQSYVKDWLTTLETHLQGLREETHDQVQAALGDYRARREAQSARALLDQLEARAQTMTAQMEEKQLLADPEFRMLAAAIAQLKGVKEDLNIYNVAQTLQNWGQSFLNQSNPFFRLVFNEWDNLRKQVKTEFENYKDEDRRVTKALVDSLGGNLSMRVAGSEQVYFDALREKRSFDYYNDKAQAWETREVLLPRFLQPGSKAWNALNPQQQAYITFKQASIKQHIKRAYAANNRSTGGYVMKAADVDAWYEKSYFAQGWIPMARASVSSQVYSGDFKEASSNMFQNLLEENNAWELDDNKARHGLSETFLRQNSEVSGDAGNNFVMKLMGLSLRGDAVNKLTGQPEERYQLSGDYENKQAELEGDLRKGLDLFVMNSLKHEVMRSMESYLMIGRVLMRQKEDQTGVFARSTEYSAVDRENMSSDEKLLVNAMDKLLHHRNNQVRDGDLREVAKYLKALGIVTRHAVLAGNFITPIRSNFATFVGNLLPNILANSNQLAGLHFKDFARALAMQTVPGNHGKLYALGQRLSILRTDERDLLQEVDMSGRKLQVLGDAQHGLIFLDRFFDDRIRLLLMTMQMLHDKTWNAYDYDGSDANKGLNQRLTYNEAAHRRIAGDAVVDFIRADQVLQGQLRPDEAMQSGYTGDMLRGMETVAEEIMGGYTDATQTRLDTNVFSQSVTAFRKYYIPRFNKAFGKARLDSNRGTMVVGEDGTVRWAEGYEVGMWKSFVKLFASAAMQSGGSLFNPRSYVRAWQGQNATEKRNNKRVGIDLMVAGALFALTKALMDDDDEEEKQKKVGLLDAAISEAFLVNQIREGYGFAGSSPASLAFAKRSGQAISDVFTGDFKAAGRFSNNIGVFKFWSAMDEAMNGPTKK